MVVKKRRERRREHPGQSTPYVREWRKENPGKLLAMRIHETDRWRGKPKPQTQEQKQRHAEIANRSQRAKNSRTRELAENFGAPWSSDEERYLVEHAIETNAAIALALGRTYHATRHRRTVLRKLGHNV